MTDMVDRASFTQRVRKMMYPNADEFPEWDTWDVFRGFIPAPRHPALSPTFTRALNGVVYYAGIPMVAASQEDNFTWTNYPPPPSKELKALADLMDLRPYREKVFTNLHENVCGLLGVENNFSTRQAVSPYTHIPNPLCEETLDSLKAKFKLTTLKDARC